MKKDGFTLLEIVIVIIVIGILAGIALPNYRKTVLKSEWVDAYVALDILYKAVHLYYDINKQWPPDQTWDIGSTDCNDINAYLASIGSPFEVPLKSCQKFSYDLYGGGPEQCDGGFPGCTIFAYRKSPPSSCTWTGVTKNILTGALTYSSNSNCYP